MPTATIEKTTGRLQELSSVFPYWEKTKDCIDTYIDLIINYRQSGHPGGSRSKVHAMVSTLLSGFMRWDIRHPEKRFGDRFILSGGHTVPLAYCTLTVLNEALRAKYDQTRNPAFLVPNAEKFQLTWENLLGFRRNRGLSGHAEMEGKTLFLKFNTGPSGHGMTAAVGQALALKRAGAEGVKVIAFEGEGGLTPGASHESKNTAWGLGLDNLYFVIDWNDFGIDAQPISSVVYGTPETWFRSYGWRTFKAENGSEWDSITSALLEAQGENTEKVPTAVWMKTRKGRGYLMYDNKSHGTPHPINSENFWATKKEFQEKYNVTFEGFSQPAPKDPAALHEQFHNNLKLVADVIREDQSLLNYLADRLVELGEQVPEKISQFRWTPKQNPLSDKALTDYEHYPPELFAKPGSKEPNRAGFSKWGSWVNSYCRTHYNRPLFLACSADLAESTNIAGFAKDFGEMKNYGRYCRDQNPEGVLLPQEITENVNAGMMVGAASVNFAEDPFQQFDGFFGTCSTYGSFVYLKYGMMRLFSQMAQDGQLKMGKVIWVAGHSGPETADDSRTHFGIFEPGVTQLFPEGHVIDAHPWEHNEVAPVLGAWMKTDIPIIALHLTRPPIEIPDRERLNLPSHMEAARGAYVLRPFRVGLKRMGTLIVQGTSTTANLVKILPQLDEAKLNVKIVAAISPQLFRMQPLSYQREVLAETEWIDSTVISNRALRLMSDWIKTDVAREYAMCSDWDNRWRTGGTIDEVLEEAHLSPQWLLNGIDRFVRERERRLRDLKSILSNLVH
ncbi:MAG: 1-deoxy-D-xylulose-5-phosphate synthase N-terminal domain-containing protein [Acidobacteriia bacterium]|nr:1-deoxy-D-xylulose-5-phosphate synthase N-terminal domain-containing protein [Terriglobia bacterium]